MTSKTTAPFLPALTGIRALCVFLIFFKHFNPFSETHALYAFTHQFFSFLSFFFVLSGFLITYRYFTTGTLKRSTIADYLVNRMSRVFPILILLISATFFLKWMLDEPGSQSLTKTYLYNITLLKGFSSEYYLTGIGPSWSMSVEELFYLIAPLIFLWVKKPGGLIAFVLYMYILGVLLTFCFRLFPLDGFFSNYHFTFLTTFFGRAFEFACGIYLAYVVQGRFSNRLLQRIPYPTLTGCTLVLAVIIAQYGIAVHYGTVNGVDTWWGLCINHLVLPVGIMIVFYGLIYEQSLLKSLLSTPWMLRMGNATYSFYLLHTSFVAGWIALYIHPNVWIIFLCMIIVSLLFHAMVEQPAATIIRKWWNRRRKLHHPPGVNP